MRKTTKLFLLFLSSLSLFSCAKEKPHQEEIRYESFLGLKEEKEDFFLFLYAPWCEHCKVSIPLVKDLFKERDDYYLMNGEELSKWEHRWLKSELLTKAKEGDPLIQSESERAFYPTIAYYKQGSLSRMKSGLPKTRKNLETLVHSFASSDK